MMFILPNLASNYVKGAEDFFVFKKKTLNLNFTKVMVFLVTAYSAQALRREINNNT